MNSPSENLSTENVINGIASETTAPLSEYWSGIKVSGPIPQLFNIICSPSEIAQSLFFKFWDALRGLNSLTQWPKKKNNGLPIELTSGPVWMATHFILWTRPTRSFKMRRGKAWMERERESNVRSEVSGAHNPSKIRMIRFFQQVVWEIHFLGYGDCVLWWITIH